MMHLIGNDPNVFDVSLYPILMIAQISNALLTGQAAQLSHIRSDRRSGSGTLHAPFPVLRCSLPFLACCDTKRHRTDGTEQSNFGGHPVVTRRESAPPRNSAQRITH
jgi:hypothetical protein